MSERVRPASEEPGNDEGGLVLERRVLTLTRQIAELINGERAEEREILREIAVNALRDQVVLEVPVDTSVPSAGGSGSFNPFGIAIPLGLMGALLIFLFPPVGIALILGAGLMLIWGVVVTLLFRS